MFQRTPSWPCLSRPSLGDCVAIVRTLLCNLQGLPDVKRRFVQSREAAVWLNRVDGRDKHGHDLPRLKASHRTNS